VTNKPKTYNLTPEHFARARADIARRRAQLDAELARLDADESAAAEIAKRYPEHAIMPKSGTSYSVDPHGFITADDSPPSKTGRSNAGRPYKNKEDGRIAAAARGQLEQLAQDLGRPYEGVLKRHEVLLKRLREAEKTDTSASDSCAPRSSTEEHSSTESRDGGSIPPGCAPMPIVEAAAAPTTAPPADPRRTSAIRGRAVDGIVDNGPGRGRILDPVAFSSR
jgi:hypothetical protein